MSNFLRVKRRNAGDLGLNIGAERRWEWCGFTPNADVPTVWRPHPGCSYTIYTPSAGWTCSHQRRGSEVAAQCMWRYRTAGPAKDVAGPAPRCILFKLALAEPRVSPETKPLDTRPTRQGLRARQAHYCLSRFSLDSRKRKRVWSVKVGPPGHRANGKNRGRRASVAQWRIASRKLSSLAGNTCGRAVASTYDAHPQASAGPAHQA